MNLSFDFSPDTRSLRGEHPFLGDHADRVRSALLFLPVLQLVNSRHQELGGNTRGLGIALQILGFLCEKMLTKDVGGATHDEIVETVAAILRVERIAAGLDSPMGELRDLVAYTLNDLQNSGRPFEYECPDPWTGKTKTYSFRLLETAYRRDAHKISLTRHGVRVYFLLRDVEQALGTDVERLFLQKQIENRYYEDALGTCGRLAAKIELTLQEYERLQEQMRAHPETVLYAETVLPFGDLVDHHLQDEKKDLKAIQDLIEAQYALLAKSWETAGLLDSTVQKTFREVLGVRNSVRDIIHRHSKLLLLYEELRRQFREAKRNQISFVLRGRRLRFDEEVFRPSLERNLPSEALHQVLSPVFGYRHEAHFHLCEMFPPAQAESDLPGETIPAPEAVTKAATEHIGRRLDYRVRHLRTLLCYLADTGEGTLEGLSRDDRPVLTISGDPGSADEEVPVCMQDMNDAEIRRFLRFLIYLHQRKDLPLRRGSFASAFQVLVDEHPEWAAFEEISVTAMLPMLAMGHNQVSNLRFTLISSQRPPSSGEATTPAP